VISVNKITTCCSLAKFSMAIRASCPTSREAAAFSSPVRQHGVAAILNDGKRRRCGTPDLPAWFRPVGPQLSFDHLCPRPNGRGY
jgi:hypothetical protein